MSQILKEIYFEMGQPLKVVVERTWVEILRNQ